MSNELALSEGQTLSVNQIKAQIQTIQQVMKGVMENGVHYGTLPGCGDKPALLKPGAEKILATFRISANPTVEDLSTPDEIRYRVKAEGQTPNGLTVGYGIGECSTNEDKYKWRAVNCDAEWESVIEDRRRTKWTRKGEGIRQVRTNPSDLANTVLKMAKKRALVDLCLTSTAASDCFSQDLDEMDEDTQAQVTGEKPPVQQPQRKQAPAAAPNVQDEPGSNDGFTEPFIGIIQKFAQKPTSKGGIRFGLSPDGKLWFNTFDAKINDFAKDASAKGLKVEIWYTEGKYGRDVTEIKYAQA